ncbi:guanylate-binding protein [Catenaria anguillulae PL171]|uniref:Guanylate-binding protein n=1 Tax=Catenaria anguillulae PL171 TaxID=765915 RepID=A0A1Y2HKF0_9FUNG|nr:guanylate-binding protein [Catenaria anguillulae PL171]
MDEPIPLVTIVPHPNDEKCPHFSVNPKAVDFLSAIQGPIGVVTIAGLYRTGKSYVLNRLAGSNRGFAVGSLVEPCTQGIYIWVISNPPPELACLLKDRSMTLVLLDTEGLGSFTKSKTYDVKMFSLSVLLSSMFLYNSMGSIDESALDRLSLVAELSNHIRLQHAADDQPDAYTLNNLRLELDGRAISSDEYLENVLKPIEGDSEKLKTRNSIRASVVQYFPDRHCFTLKRPVNDEKLLQRLDELSEAEIRPQFLEQMKHLTNTSMNSGGMPVIRSAWENVIAAECDRFLADALRHGIASGTPTWWHICPGGRGTAHPILGGIQWGVDVNFTKSQRESEHALSKVIGPVMAVLETEDVSFEKFESELSISLNEPIFQGPRTGKASVLTDFLSKKLVTLAKSIHTKHWNRREQEITEEMRRRTDAAESDRINSENLLRDLRQNFLKSREEVEQLARENQALINVVAKFPDAFGEEELPRNKQSPDR